MKPNKHGCRVSQDVCIMHDSPLVCKHGCEESLCGCKEWKENMTAAADALKEEVLRVSKEKIGIDDSSKQTV